MKIVENIYFELKSLYKMAKIKWKRQIVQKIGFLNLFEIYLSPPEFESLYDFKLCLNFPFDVDVR